MKNTYLVYILTVFILSISCSQLDDSFRLPGENSDDIVYYELNNDYLAPESREFIESNFPSVNVNSSYILIGKNTYGFEADLTNEMSLSFDEDGVFKFDREHPFIKDYYKKGINTEHENVLFHEHHCSGPAMFDQMISAYKEFSCYLDDQKSNILDSVSLKHVENVMKNLWRVKGRYEELSN